MRIAYYTSYLGKEFISKYGKGKKFALSGPLKSLGIARSLLSGGHEVEIFSPGVTTCETTIPEFNEVEEYPEGKLTVHYCRITSKRKCDPINQYRCQKLLLKAHRRNHFDMVLYYNITLGAALMLPKIKNTLRVLEYEDNIFNKSLVGGKSNFDAFKKWMYNRIVGRTDGLMAVCNGLMLPGIKCKVLTPGIIDDEVIRNVSSRRNKLTEGKPVTVILTGGIHYSKGGDLLVGAMRYINTPCRVKVFGNCNLDENLKSLIAQVPAKHSFEFCGYVPHGELIKILDNEADILINTTRSMGVGAQAAGFPFKMMEYASTGRPIVSSEIGKLDNQFNSHITYFEEETAESVASAIERVIADYDNKVVSALELRDIVLKEYSLQGLARKINRFLSKLANGPQ